LGFFLFFHVRSASWITSSVSSAPCQREKQCERESREERDRERESEQRERESVRERAERERERAERERERASEGERKREIFIERACERKRERA